MTDGGHGNREKIKFTNFSKSFGDLLVLDNLNFSVKENDFLCIVGPTGCGKTTLCNLITTLIPPSKGTVEINGEPADPRKHNISFVFQEPSCLPWRNVWDDIKFGLEIKGYSREQIRERVSRIIELVGLKDFVNYYPHQISAGMKQRVAIARAFVTKPDLLLMDEPFGQLDIKTRFYMMDEVLKLWREIKATIVYVTHNLEEAIYLGEEVIVLSQKPTHIKSTIPVDLSRPRDYSDPKFVEKRKLVTELVKWW
jgi:ABC-type nitrate/sulfonate/bicarbonate transport system ATPase subunit